MGVETVPLSSLAKINPKRSKGIPSDAPVSFVGMSDIDAESGSIAHEEERSFADTSKGFTQFDKGDILMAKITPCFENRKIAQAGINKPLGSGSTEFHVIRAREEVANVRFILHLLRHPKVILNGERKMTGSSGHRRVPEAYVSNIPVPSYSVWMQEKIAASLDSIESLRAKRRRSIKLIDELMRSIFLDMFDEALKEEYPKKTLGECLNFLTSGSRGWAKYYSDKSGGMFLRIQNVKKNEIDLSDVAYVNAPNTAESKRTSVYPGDVLLSITADLGRTAVVPDGLGDVFINQHLSILRASEVSPEYLSAYLSSEYGQRQLFGKNRVGVKSGLNFDDIRSIEIPVPSRSSQEEYEKNISIGRDLKAKYQTHLAYLDELFASVQQRAFNGTLWDDRDIDA